MTSGRTHTEKTSADDKSIGFDFQYYYFLYRLINLKTGESVGLEVKDDVHTELNNDRQILVQLKHTTQTKADGSAINLTELDDDLWKTIFNWCKVITDKSENRTLESTQLMFVEKTDFILASNKVENEKNNFIKNLRKFKVGKINHKDLIDVITAIQNKSKNIEIKNHIAEILKLPPGVCEAFLKNIAFDLGNDDLIKKCKTSIKEAKIPENKIDDVFSSLDSQIRADNFIKIKNGEKIIIDFETFYRQYRRHFDQGRNADLIIKEFNFNFPDDLKDQEFIKQLLHIDDIAEDDLEAIADFTRCKLHVENNIDNWIKAGDISPIEKDRYEAEAEARWRIKFRASYRGMTDENLIISAARKLVDKIREERLEIAGLQLGTEMSNGTYYHLSDVLQIGWHKNWETLFK